MKTKSKLSFFTDKPYLIWAILFIIAPLLMVAYYALTDKTGAFSLASVEQIPTYITTILLSVFSSIAFSAAYTLFVNVNIPNVIIITVIIAIVFFIILAPFLFS